jgi:hypothetical protein
LKNLQLTTADKIPMMQKTYHDEGGNNDLQKETVAVT